MSSRHAVANFDSQPRATSGGPSRIGKSVLSAVDKDQQRQARRDQLSNPDRAQRLSRLGGRSAPARLARLCLFGRLGAWADRQFRRPARHGSGGKERRSAVGISHCGDLRRRRRDHFALGHARRPRERGSSRQIMGRSVLRQRDKEFPVESPVEAGRLYAGSAASFPLVPDSDAGERSAKSSEGRVTRDDDGGVVIAPVGEVD